MTSGKKRARWRKQLPLPYVQKGQCIGCGEKPTITHACNGMVDMNQSRTVKFDLQSVHQPAFLHTSGLFGCTVVVVITQGRVSPPVYRMTMLHSPPYPNVIQPYLESVLNDIRCSHLYMPRLVIVKAPGELSHGPHGCELVVCEPFRDVLDTFVQQADGLQVVIEPYRMGDFRVYNTGIAVKAAVFSDDGTAYVNYTRNKGIQHTLCIPRIHVLAPEPVPAGRGRCARCQMLNIERCHHGQKTWV